jgi:hypothetical protein
MYLSLQHQFRRLQDRRTYDSSLCQIRDSLATTCKKLVSMSCLVFKFQGMYLPSEILPELRGEGQPIYTKIFACLRSCIAACLRDCIAACLRSCIAACLRSCIAACLRSCVAVCLRSCVAACLRSCVAACLRRTPASPVHYITSYMNGRH